MDNFIIDITKSQLATDEIYEQAEYVFRASNTRFVKKIVIIQEDDVLRVIQRK